MNKSLQLFALALGVRLLVLAAIYLLTDTTFAEYAVWYDGQDYLEIARSFPLPYDPPAMLDHAKHYPLFPFLAYLLSFLFKDMILSAYIVSVAAGSLAVVVFYKLARRYTQNAFDLGVMFSCFPPKWLSTATFLWSEPLFLLVLLFAFLLLAENRNSAAYAMLSLATLARPVGIMFLGSFILYEFIRKTEKPMVTLMRLLLAVLPFLLFHAYLSLRFGQMLVFLQGAEGGSWGGKILALPLAGLVSGLADPGLLTVRKIYTSTSFALYTMAFGVALASLRDRRLALLTLWFIPYFVFTCFLRGGTYNWWMISFARLALPVAPAGLILVGRHFSNRFAGVASWVAVPVGVLYSIAVVFIRASNVIR